MTKEYKILHELCETLGSEYSVVTIDWEPVIYRDFNNGFNVELSGLNGPGNRKATVYLWHDSNTIVLRAYEVERDQIPKVVEEMHHFTKQLIERGRDTPEELRKVEGVWPLEYILMNRPKTISDDDLWNGMKREKIPDSTHVKKNKIIRIRAADMTRDYTYLAVYLDPTDYKEVRVPIRSFSPHKPHSIVWPSNGNGCCEGWPIVITTNLRPDGSTNYSAQCACDGWCTNGHNTPQETVDEYWRMTQRKIEHPEYY